MTISLPEILHALPGFYLAVAVSLPQASLLWVVEPLDPDHHTGAPWLPEALHSAHIGQLGPAGWQEHSAVPDTDCFLAPHNGLVEKLAGFTLQTSPLWRKEKTALSWFRPFLPFVSSPEQTRARFNMLYQSNKICPKQKKKRKTKEREKNSPVSFLFLSIILRYGYFYLQ